MKKNSGTPSLFFKTDFLITVLHIQHHLPVRYQDRVI